ncbi:MAG: hypothetical protein ACK4U0_17365 [Mesorhizobium sp.]
MFREEEFLDLIAEAARTSPHAAKAYQLIVDEHPATLPLAKRQRLIDARQSGVPV